MAKNIESFFGEYEYFFLNIILNHNFFSDLKCKYYCENFPEMLLQVNFK